MQTVSCRGLLVVACALCAALVSAQITFSRDWTGGKRSAPQPQPQPQLAIDCGQFTRLCRHFVHELKEAMSSEITGKGRREDVEKPPFYEDDN